MSRTINVWKEKILLSKRYKHALAIRLLEEARSRMRTADHLMRILKNFDGQVVVGKHYILRLHSDLVYDAFGEDMAFSWATAVKRFAHRLPMRRSSPSQLLRYQIFDCVYKITDNPIALPEGYRNWE